MRGRGRTPICGIRQLDVADHGGCDRGRVASGWGWRHSMGQMPTGSKADRTKPDATRSSAPAPMDESVKSRLDFNVRTRVHEYGGGAFAVAERSGDLRPRRRSAPVPPGSQAARCPNRLTPESDCALRYADIVFDDRANRIICVREDHRGGGEAVNCDRRRLAHGRATVGTRARSWSRAPTSSPRRACRRTDRDWPGSPGIIPICPGTAPIYGRPRSPGRGSSVTAKHVAGGEERIDFPAGVVAERRSDLRLRPERLVEPLSPCQRDRRRPGRSARWRPSSGCRCGSSGCGPTTCSMTAGSSVRTARAAPGRWRSSILTGGAWTESICRTDEIDNVSASGATVLFHGGSPSTPKAIVRLDLATGERTELRRATGTVPDPGYLSTPRTVEFPTEGGLTAFGFFYPPANRDFAGPEGEQPPLLVLSHGGPTGATEPSFELPIQYWTSRGIAVLDVNYGGSTGYGRAYRERLNGAWGIVDVDDCCNGARWLAEQGRGRRRPADDPGRQRRRVHHAGGADLPRCLRGRCEPLRHQRPWRRWRPIPTSSKAVTSTT